MDDNTVIKVNPDSKKAEENPTNSNHETIIDSIPSTSNNLKHNPMNKTLTQTKSCYCYKERNFNIVELLCANCDKWYHESCIGYQLGKLIPFMMNYVFICKICSPSGLENFKKNQALISEMCITAVGNLTQESIKKGDSKVYFSGNRDIIPFIDLHWDSITTTAKRTFQSRFSLITKTLLEETNTVFDMTKDENDSPSFKLQLNLSQIKPNYEAMIRSGQLKVTEHGIQLELNKGRSSKRKVLADNSASVSNSGKKGRSEVNQLSVNLSGHGYPLEHPFNRDGFKYILSEPDPHAPIRQEFDECNEESALKLIPSGFSRTVCPNQVLLALHDRAPQLQISDDRLSVIGEKGYSSVRATHSVHNGNWYWEVTVKKMPDNSACRIGWGQEFLNLQTPLGYDKFGYSWRSRKGTVFHDGRGKHYSDGYREGDTLGMMICLPNNNVFLPPNYKSSPLIKFKSHLYYKVPQGTADASKNLTPLIGSKIIFYKNGECFNEGAVDLYKGNYFPTLSLFKNCELSVNFGPDFKYPPSQTDDFKYQGVSERAIENVCEQTLADLSYFC